MTQPIKTQAKHHPAAKTVTVSRQSQPEKSIHSVKKAPAPPPNPALVKPQKSYDKHTDGALTYFNYYFEDLTTPAARADYPAPPSRSKIPVGAVGAGVVAVTLASGAMIADALHQPEAPRSDQPQDSEVKQKAEAQNPRPTTIAPEKLETGRSLSASPSESPVTKTPTNRQPAPTLKRTQSAADSLITRGPLISNAQPLKLAPLSSPAPRSAPSNSTVSSQPDPSGTGSNSRIDAIRSAIARQLANSPAVAPPETLPPAGTAPGMAGATTLPANTNSGAMPAGNGVSQPVNPTSSQFPSQSTNSQTTPFPPDSGLSTSALPSNPNPGQLSGSSQAGTAAPINSVSSSGVTTSGANSTVNAAVSPSREMMPGSGGMAPGDRLLETGSATLNRLTAAPTTGSSVSNAATASVSLANNAAEGIQDYLNRPPKAAAEAPALMPLSSKAAGEAAAKPQVGPFTVRQVSQQDYQKEWQTSNRNPSDPAIAYAFPAYGFIDYQRQIIVVLKEQPNLNPLQSQRPTTPSS